MDVVNDSKTINKVKETIADTLRLLDIFFSLFLAGPYFLDGYFKGDKEALTVCLQFDIFKMLGEEKWMTASLTDKKSRYYLVEGCISTG